MRPIYVCLSTDENYAQLATVAITSIFENNRNAPEIEIYVLDGGIKNLSKNIMLQLAQEYNRKLIFIDVRDRLKKLEKMKVNKQGKYKSYAAYSRFFIADEIPAYIDKILYIDCDTCINQSLQDLFNINLDKYVIAAVLDILPDSHKRHIGFEAKDNYYNSGVILFNCKKWRDEKYIDKILYHIQYVQNSYSFHDQDLINIVCKGKILTLEPKYMVFYPEYTWGSKKINWLNEIQGTYYNDTQLIDAINNPIIIHYVDSILGRPWYSDNINKYAYLWSEMLEISPYSKTFKILERHNSMRHKLMRIIYLYLPLKLFLYLHKFRRNQLLKEREKQGILKKGGDE